MLNHQWGAEINTDRQAHLNGIQMYSTPGLTPTDAVPAPPGAVSAAELDLRTVERLRRSEHERTLARLSALGIVRQSEQSIAWVGDLQQGDGGVSIHGAG